MSIADRPKTIAVGGACATSIYRVDTVPPLPAKAIANALCRVADGMAISAACGFTRLGGEAAVWARVGDDVDGAFIRASLAAEGLDVSAIRVLSPGRSSSVAVVVDGRGQRLVVPFHDPELDDSAAWLPLDALRGAGIVHVDARWAAGAAAALGSARAHGIPTMLDGDVAPREVLARLVPLADFAVFSDAGFLAYTAASLKCTRFGGRIGCPTRAEVDAALAGRVVG